MARGVNKVILLGNLGDDPKLIQIADSLCVTNLNIATNSSYIDKTTNNRVEKTDWHRVVCFNKLAQICCKFLHRGSRIYLEGYLRTRKWLDKDLNIDRYTTEIVMVNLEMLDQREKVTHEEDDEDSQPHELVNDFNPNKQGVMAESGYERQFEQGRA